MGGKSFSSVFYNKEVATKFQFMKCVTNLMIHINRESKSEPTARNMKLVALGIVVDQTWVVRLTQT